MPAHNRIAAMVKTMPETDIKDAITEKSLEIKKMFKEMSATLEQWKFSIEDTKEGTRVEIHATALIKRKKE
jgi:hypothetical protein